MRHMTNLRIEDERKQLPANPAAMMYASRAQRVTTHTVSAGNPLERSEAELIARVKGGDVEAFYEMVHPYERAVFLAALHWLSMTPMQKKSPKRQFSIRNIFLLPRQEAKFSTWLIQISINEAKMKLRKDRRHLYESMEAGQQNDEGDYIPKDFADWREIPSEALEQKELRKALTRALRVYPRLTPYRIDLAGRTSTSASLKRHRSLGLSEANVKTRLRRARLQMRDALAPGFDGAWRRGRTYEKVRPF